MKCYNRFRINQLTVWLQCESKKLYVIWVTSAICYPSHSKVYWNMCPSNSKIDLYEQYQKEMKKIVSDTNKKTQTILKKLKDQSKPEVGSV